jgi:hypothetical protein
MQHMLVPAGKLAKHQAQLCQMSIPGFYEPLWPANLMDNAQKFPKPSSISFVVDLLCNECFAIRIFSTSIVLFSSGK